MKKDPNGCIMIFSLNEEKDGWQRDEKVREKEGNENKYSLASLKTLEPGD